ncbi:MAG TPA: class I SAM-dependent methyltransferase [Kofleriaceae bacterium]
MQENTLTTIAPLLARLFQHEKEARAQLDALMNSVPPAEQQRLLRSRTDYLDFYGRLKDVPLAVSPATGTLLYMLVRNARATSIVEFGTSFAISTLHLAAAVRDNGGGKIITSEFEPSKVARARENLAAGGLADLVEIRVGDALETLRTNLPDRIDLVLLDGAKSLYNDILGLLESRLRPGALVLADNADMCPEYLERVRSASGGYLSIPFDEDVELSMRM